MKLKEGGKASDMDSILWGTTSKYKYATMLLTIGCWIIGLTVGSMLYFINSEFVLFLDVVPTAIIFSTLVGLVCSLFWLVIEINENNPEKNIKHIWFRMFFYNLIMLFSCMVIELKYVEPISEPVTSIIAYQKNERHCPHSIRLTSKSMVYEICREDRGFEEKFNEENMIVFLHGNVSDGKAAADYYEIARRSVNLKK